jgi:D-aspartate ligase
LAERGYESCNASRRGRQIDARMMSLDDISTPVLVLNAGHHGALGITRSLGRLGITVFTQAQSRSAPAFSSRYSSRNILWDACGERPEQTVEFLLSMGRELSRPALLIPTCDITAMLVADHDAQFREWFLFPKQRPELVHTLCSKKGLYHLAKSLGIPTPETSFPESRSAVLRFLESASFPVLLKTVKNTIGKQATHGLKVIVQDEKELLSLYDRLEDPDDPNLMLQDYIPGDEDANWMFNGYFDQASDCLVGFTGKKIRQSPAYAGVTSLGICIRNDAVANTAKAFMKAIGYQGVLDMGYRLDARDGAYKVYDVNPRIGGSFRLFVDDEGLDVARALYAHMTGQSITPGAPRQGRKWIIEDSDLLSSIRYYRDARLSLGGWIRSLKGIEESAIFALDDPRPVLTRAVNDVRKLLVGRESTGGR